MRRIPTGATFAASTTPIAVLLAAASLVAAPEAAADDTLDFEPHIATGTAPAPSPRDRIEFRRQNSERGTPEESTRTTLRLEHYLKEGVVTRLRLDLPFPDEKTDFGGSPFQPQLGDIKVRAYFRPFQAAGTRMSSDVEVTFPTADSPDSGAGKYQLSAALHSVPGAPDFVFASGHHQLRYEWDIRQTVSVAGDADRKDINNTKPEFGLRDIIGRNSLKLSFKPTIDWIQDGKTGAVLELEGAWSASPEWRFSLKGGAGLWGEGTPGFYHRRVEVVAGRTF
jgi:hypothetical protein